MRLENQFIKVSPMKKFFLVLILSALAIIAEPTNHLSAEEDYTPPFAASAVGDWLQLGNDPQRTNYTSLQVDPPYCYTWKWYEAPIASRAQPIVSNGRLFIGSMDGVMYARDASTGAPLWTFVAGGPIRHSAGVINNAVIFSAHDGYTYALDVGSGGKRSPAQAQQPLCSMPH
jgi:glucose dehydrogenase